MKMSGKSNYAVVVDEFSHSTGIGRNGDGYGDGYGDGSGFGDGDGEL